MDWYQPVWLNKNFVKKVLQGGDEKEDIMIMDLSVRSAVTDGDGFILSIYRVKVKYKLDGVEEMSSLIVKIPPLRGFLHYNLDNAGFFSKEYIIYSRLLTAMSDKVNFEFGPSLLYSPVNSCLVLEDLREEGYVMCDEYKQLDLKHCIKVVETLAKFHACSVSCYLECPKFIEAVGEDILWTESCVLKPWIQSAVQTVLMIVSHMDNCGRFSNFLASRMDLLWESVVKISKPKLTGLNVLNHGDLWVNNVFFKYDDEGQIEDVKFIDYQITKFATPALDLLNFIWTSANEEVREKSQPELYLSYLEVFNSTMEQLDCEGRLTLEELREDLMMAADWGVLMICCALPVIMSSPEDAPNLSGFTSEDFGTDKFKKIYSGKRFQLLLPSIIKQFTNSFLIENIL